MKVMVGGAASISFFLFGSILMGLVCFLFSLKPSVVITEAYIITLCICKRMCVCICICYAAPAEPAEAAEAAMSAEPAEPDEPAEPAKPAELLAEL